MLTHALPKLTLWALKLTQEALKLTQEEIITIQDKSLNLSQDRPSRIDPIALVQRLKDTGQDAAGAFLTGSKQKSNTI